MSTSLCPSHDTQRWAPPCLTPAAISPKPECDSSKCPRWGWSQKNERFENNSLDAPWAQVSALRLLLSLQAAGRGCLFNSEPLIQGTRRSAKVFKHINMHLKVLLKFNQCILIRNVTPPCWPDHYCTLGSVFPVLRAGCHNVSPISQPGLEMCLMYSCTSPHW